MNAYTNLAAYVSITDLREVTMVDGKLVAGQAVRTCRLCGAQVAASAIWRISPNESPAWPQGIPEAGMYCATCYPAAVAIMDERMATEAAIRES